MEKLVIDEAKSIYKGIDEQPVYEEIVNRIDYLLLNAPIKLKEKVNDKDANKLKGYQPK
jgi:hypothetical protein